MSFKSILGQPLAVDLAQRWLAQHTTQPLLLYGPEGAGKRTLALELAKALNCQRIIPSPLRGEGEDGGDLKSPPPQSSPTRGEELLWDPCGQCLSCRKIHAGHHPDVRVLDLSYQARERGEPLEKQQALRIETIQDERRRLYETALEGSWKVSLLDDADRLTPDAASVLLKILEEPPPRTAIFLVTPHRDRLFATLISRCQPIRFRPRRSPTGTSVSEEINAIWKTLPQKSPAAILAESPARSKMTALDRARVQDRLEALLELSVRSLRAANLEAIAWVDLIQKAQQQIRKNVQPGLVYDHLLLQLAQQRKV